MRNYTIIIPIYNEEKSIPSLLDNLKLYIKNDNEIIIIDDGSTDSSNQILKKNKKINLIQLKNNKGKGYAIRKGLRKAINKKIIIFDGDLEIHTDEIKKLMILDKDNNVFSTMGYRFKKIFPLKSVFDLGNFSFTNFYNFLFKTQHRDILCCAKSFYLDLIKISELKSNSFDIDIELAHFLSKTKSSNNPLQIYIKYKRRKINEGKKLKISDGWVILSRIIRLNKKNI
tara:strand:+ start:409 stop:1092 length:684 start_codon:yes stop_codon:yes gene_type:complete